MSARDPLAEYNRKRDFKLTAEPAGKRASSKGGNRFIVQKHDATRLHWDLRLEADGVLKSWAVTKGPSPDPEIKRLAVRTEDHPLSYAEFEGTIPKGEYGGGTVMLWDRGWWEPLHDPAKGLKEGKLHFRLHGERMTGGWALVRMSGNWAASRGQMVCPVRNVSAWAWARWPFNRTVNGKRGRSWPVTHTFGLWLAKYVMVSP